MKSQELRLDHFKIYDVNDYEVREKVTLKGQFDREADSAKVCFLNYYCNPVSKNEEPLYDRDAHLAWYSIYQPVPEPMRIVVIQNQFGTSKLILGRPFALLVPSRKQGHQFPEKLDHYKLYEVLEGEPLNKEVSLKDQFESDRTRVTCPIAFGVPVTKRHDNQEFPINNEKAHLAIYRITPRPIQETRAARDQFGSKYLFFMRSIALAIPSVKERWEEYP